MGNRNYANAGMQVIVGVFVAVVMAATSTAQSNHGNRQTTDRELAQRILQDERMDAVVRMGHELLKSGMTAGSGYSEVWIRDLNTFIVPLLEVAPRQSVREALLVFFHFQGEDGNIVDGYVPKEKGHVGYKYRFTATKPDLQAHKNTVETDQESSLVQAVCRYIRKTKDTTILDEVVRDIPVRKRLEMALEYPLKHRYCEEYGLIWGATTADWGDVQPEHEWGVELDANSHRSIDIYDNALLLVAIGEYLETACSRDAARKNKWTGHQERLRKSSRRVLWDEAAEKFIPHIYLEGSPFPKEFDENNIFYHGGTAVAIEAGLLKQDEIVASHKRMRENMGHPGAATIGLTMYPPYPAEAFKNRAMSPYSYQNGGDWTWFGARMVRQLAQNGCIEESYRELVPMLERVLKHRGFFEWWTPSNQPKGSGKFRGSAGVLIEAINELREWAKNLRGAGAVADAEQPNIIFIFSDDLSYRDLSSYGQQAFSTPNLDRLAASGLRFTQAYSGSPECAPSRGSLMTGMHMGHCRIRANRSVRGQDHLKAEDVTVAEILKQAGYATGFIGKWGIGLPGTEGAPHIQGFDLAYGFYDQRRAHGFFPHYLMRNGKVEKHPENYGFNMRRVYQYNGRSVDRLEDVKNRYDDDGRLVPDGVPDPAKATHSENLFQREAVTFIRRNHDRPFFLYYATQLPHGPCITPDLGVYRDKPWDQKHKEWAAMMTHLDDGVGKIVQALKQQGIEKNTVIFFAGDNGYSQWGYFGRAAHQDDPVFRNKGPWPKGKFTCTHEGGMRVPLFAYWPGTIQPGESSRPCALYDFAATAADLASVASSPTDGISLLPTLLGKSDQQRDHAYLYWENGTRSPHVQSARRNSWWAYRIHPTKPVQLYRLDQDLLCERDVASDHPDVVKQFREIFNEAHVPSQWYVNPGEDKEQVEAKRQKAQATNSMQVPVGANTQRGPW